MKFKKYAFVFASILILGALVSVAATSTYPLPFVKNGEADVAIVYGVNSAVSDLTAANKISNNLKSLFDSFYEDWEAPSGDFSNSLGITEIEVFLGTLLSDSKNGDMRKVFKDNQIPSLIDEEISWDDGLNSKTNFDVHEEILLGNMKLITTLDEIDLEGVALTNKRDLEYRYVFEEDLVIERIPHDDADMLTINILGKEYEVKEFSPDSMTISTSEEKILTVGESLSVDGITITVEDIFDDVVQVNNELINEGSTETVDGLKVSVVSIAYHSSATLPSKVILKVGKEIYTTYNDGDAYIGEDETDPVWVWTIENPGLKDGFIGVKYDLKEVDADDNLVYVGDSYTFPENYATVSLDELTDVEYSDFEVSFDDSRDLYLAEDDGDEMYENAKVVVLSGTLEDSFLINDDVETDTLYLRYNPEADSYENEIVAEVTELLENGTTIIVSPAEYETIYIPGVDVFFSDITEEYGNVKPRFAFTLIESGDIADLVYEDTDLGVSIDEGVLSVGELSIVLGVDEDGNFTHLGEDSETAVSDEILMAGKNVGNEDEDVLSHFGLILYDSESNAENDEVLFGVPSEQVFATISVLGIGEDVVDETVPQFGIVLVKDTEVASVATKNLIVVGGSCVNTVAAKLLGSDVPLCGAAWTAKTNAGVGQYVVTEYASPYDASKTALLVAGYEAADTTAAVDTLFV